MRCLVLVLLVVACSRPAAPTPAPPSVVVAAPPIDAVPTPPTEPLASPDPEPVDAGIAPEPLVNPTAGTRAEFHCFAWIHGAEFSTDCYRTAATCETERKAMEAGARPTRPCEKVTGASCTMVGRRKMKKEERCFGDPNNCGRYRAFVTGNGLDVTPCTDK